MNHKYLRELFPDGDLPFPFSEEGYPDFDERDTFSMDNTFLLWMYERLRYFQEEVSKTVDFEFHKFNICGEELTQMECINRMTECCKKLILTDDIFAPDSEELLDLDKTKDELFDIFKAVFWAMWW